MIKLNIQRFSSTNKTTHYDLSQYVSSDLPTYLVDYNSDMSKIDTAINAAQTTADTASTAATNAATVASTAQSTANTAVTNAATADGKAVAVDTKVGDLANLTTTDKTNIVSAVNEVKGITANHATQLLTLTPVELYDGTNADDGSSNITLSDSISNYQKIEVEFYCDGNSSYGIEEFIIVANGTYNLFDVCLASGNVSAYSRLFTISGTTVSTTYNRKCFITTGSVEATNGLTIKKIVGFKYE